MAKKFFPSKILVASAGSPPSRLAIMMASEIAEATGSELHLVGIASASRFMYPDNLSDGHVERMLAEVQRRVDEEVKEVEGDGVKITQTHVRLGRVDVEVLRLAEELDVAMVVVGNRGEGAFSRILLGSDAESIVRHAHCPVLVAREETR